MRPTGKIESPGRGFHPGEARAGCGGGVGAWFHSPRKDFFFFFPDSAEKSHWGLGNRTHPDPGENQRSSWGDPVATS